MYNWSHFVFFLRLGAASDPGKGGIKGGVVFFLGGGWFRFGFVEGCHFAVFFSFWEAIVSIKDQVLFFSASQDKRPFQSARLFGVWTRCFCRSFTGQFFLLFGGIFVLESLRRFRSFVFLEIAPGGSFVSACHFQICWTLSYLGRMSFFFNFNVWYCRWFFCSRVSADVRGFCNGVSFPRRRNYIRKDLHRLLIRWMRYFFFQCVRSSRFCILIHSTLSAAFVYHWRTTITGVEMRSSIWWDVARKGKAKLSPSYQGWGWIEAIDGVVIGAFRLLIFAAIGEIHWRSESFGSRVYSS